MILYLIIILVCDIIIVGINILFNPNGQPFYYYLEANVIFLFSLILIDALVALIIRKMPEKYFTLHNPLCRVSKKSQKLYRMLKVDKWKDYVPELGGFTNFHKDKLKNPYDNEYISKFILEVCYGTVIHVISAPCSFLILLIDYQAFLGQSRLLFTMALPMAVINAILIYLPAMVLRYNIPRLKIIYDFNLSREKLKQKQAENNN